MRLLGGQASSARTSHEQAAIQREISAADRRIDDLIYELYCLTDEEIAIVEAGLTYD